MSNTRTSKRRPFADAIMQGGQEIETMIEGERPAEIFTVGTAEIPEPSAYSAKDVRRLRQRLGVSQAVFAELVGVSRILVQSWELGARAPSALARRLLDTVKADPPKWLATIRKIAG